MRLVADGVELNDSLEGGVCVEDVVAGRGAVVLVLEDATVVEVEEDGSWNIS